MHNMHAACTRCMGKDGSSPAIVMFPSHKLDALATTNEGGKKIIKINNGQRERANGTEQTEHRGMDSL